MLYQFFLVLFRRKWMLIITFMVLVGGVCAYTYIEYPLYKATVKIMVRQNPKQQLILFRNLETPAQRDIRILPARNLIEISRSQEIAQKIVSLYGLDARLARRNQSPETEREYIWYWINAIINSPIRFGEILGLFPESEPNYEQNAIDLLLDNRLDISLVAETEIINLSIWEESPKLASDIANTLAELLIQKTTALDQLKASSAYVFTKDQVEIAGQELERMEKSLIGFRNREQIIALSQEKQLKLKRLDILEAEFAKIVAQEEELRAQLVEVQNRLQRVDPHILASTVIAHNPLVTELKASLYREEMEWASLKPEMRESHPEIARRQAKIGQNMELLEAEREQIVQSETTTLNMLHRELTTQSVRLQAEIEGLSAKGHKLKEQITALKKELLAISGKEVTLNQLDRKTKTQETLFLNLKNKLGELEIQQVNRLSEFDINIIDKAYLPLDSSADYPDWEFNVLLIGVPSALLLALLLAFFVDFWDDSYDSAQKLRRDIELPVLGRVPKLQNITDII
jgi:uncharacterized protein involved in exopolysaccharide biosynthesis